MSLPSGQRGPGAPPHCHPGSPEFCGTRQQGQATGTASCRCWKGARPRPSGVLTSRAARLCCATPRQLPGRTRGCRRQLTREQGHRAGLPCRGHVGPSQQAGGGQESPQGPAANGVLPCPGDSLPSTSSLRHLGTDTASWSQLGHLAGEEDGTSTLQGLVTGPTAEAASSASACMPSCPHPPAFCTSPTKMRPAWTHL